MWLLMWLPIGGHGIVNPSNESANMVIYMLPAKDVGMNTWQVGVDCLDSFAQIFFYRNPLERYTRAYNLMLTHVFNMSLPAAQICTNICFNLSLACCSCKLQAFFVVIAPVVLLLLLLLLPA